MTEPAVLPTVLDEPDDARLRRDIRRLGELLGETLAAQESPRLVDQIEDIPGCPARRWPATGGRSRASPSG